MILIPLLPNFLRMGKGNGELIMEEMAWKEKI